MLGGSYCEHGQPILRAADTQLALMNVVVQTIPDLANGSVDSAKLQSLLTAAQKTAQTSLDKAP